MISIHVDGISERIVGLVVVGLKSKWLMSMHLLAMDERESRVREVILISQ
jgi:hypothetical protein